MSLSGKRFIPTPTTWQWSARSVVVGTDPAHFCPTTTQISSARVSRTTLRRSVPSGSPQSTCAFWTTPPVDERFVDQIGALVAARDDGLIAGIGISNVTHQHLVRALEVTDIVCVQNWYNLADRSASRVLDECIVRGIAFVPFGPLGRGDVIRANPVVTGIATGHAATHIQVALGWLLAIADNVLLIPGTSSRGHLAENLGADSVLLQDDEIARLTPAFSQP